MNFRELVYWLKDNPPTLALLIICLTLLLTVAMVVGLDLAWVPELLQGWFGG